MDHVGLDYVMTYVFHKIKIFIMSFVHDFGKLNEVFAMQGGSDVGAFVRHIVALFIPFRGNPFVNVLFRRMPFHPCNSNSIGTLGLDRLVKVVPKVAIAY